MMADLELREEEVKNMLQEITKIDKEWKDLWNQLQKLEDNVKKSEDINHSENPEASGDAEVESSKTDAIITEEQVKHQGASDVQGESLEKDSSRQNEQSKIKEIKSKLFAMSSEQQKIIGKIANLTSQTIVPLRDNLQNVTKQLYYVKTDISADKIVCEVSGNFMSSRDAEERIAAHYAGKQYVGWKMVREKFAELEKKMRNWRPAGPPPGRNSGRNGPPSGHSGYGGPGYHDNGGRGRYNDRGGRHDNGQGYGYGGRDRSRNRDSGGGGYHRRSSRDGGYWGRR
eukprot:279226_1